MSKIGPIWPHFNIVSFLHVFETCPKRMYGTFLVFHNPHAYLMVIMVIFLVNALLLSYAHSAFDCNDGIIYFYFHKKKIPFLNTDIMCALL
jgi:hypothetical protein